MSPASVPDQIIALIAAMDRRQAIGRDGGLPWRLPDEMRYFRRTTMGKPVIMGRKTYDTIGKPLTGRTNIILTRNPAYQAPGCHVVHNVTEALVIAANTSGETGEIIVAGGAAVGIACSKADEEPTADHEEKSLEREEIGKCK